MIYIYIHSLDLTRGSLTFLYRWFNNVTTRWNCTRRRNVIALCSEFEHCGIISRKKMLKESSLEEKRISFELISVFRGQVHCQPLVQHLCGSDDCQYVIQPTLPSVKWNRVLEMSSRFRFRPDKFYRSLSRPYRVQSNLCKLFPSNSHAINQHCGKGACSFYNIITLLNCLTNRWIFMCFHSLGEDSSLTYRFKILSRIKLHFSNLRLDSWNEPPPKNRTRACFPLISSEADVLLSKRLGLH